MMGQLRGQGKDTKQTFIYEFSSPTKCNGGAATESGNWRDPKPTSSHNTAQHHQYKDGLNDGAVKRTGTGQ